MLKDIEYFPTHIQDLIRHFNFDRLPVEGTFYNSTYRSTESNSDGKSCGTAMIGMYCNEPLSVSCFHKLQSDEVWHFYGGDPFYLYLLYPDGTHEKVLLGSDVLSGQKIQYVVPAGVWQAGALAPGGVYALFGCTMAPGFTGTGFEAAIGEELEKQYPDLKDIIRKLSVNGHQTKMPVGFAE
ncbi:cupin domain-containing protein [Wukongibacter baidiensis]|uniref:cupin domain-containing protein n=1 Tax=Wukongibacter baidiensis TaxID=1723361 RepID=UPI003D7F39A5